MVHSLSGVDGRSVRADRLDSNGLPFCVSKTKFSVSTVLQNTDRLVPGPLVTGKHLSRTSQ